MVLLQETGEWGKFLGRATEWGSLTLCGKEFKSKPNKSESRFIQRSPSIGRIWSVSESESSLGMLGRLVFMGWITARINNRRNILTVWGRSGGVQELGHCPLVGLLWLFLELWRLWWWVCHLVNVSQWAYNEAYVLLANFPPSWA